MCSVYFKIMLNFGIIGTGKFIPSKKIDNNFIGRKTGISKSWIYKKTGIKKRYFAGKHETCSYMAYKAALSAIKNAKIKKEKIDYIICCTFTADYKFPSLASKVSQLLNLKSAGCYDLMANCTGFQVGLSSAAEKLNFDKNLRNILVIGATLQSKFLNWKNPENSMYFGDGAGAALVSRVPKNYGYIGADLIGNSLAYEDVKLVGGGSSLTINEAKKNNKSKFLYEMNGLETWKQVVTYQPTVIEKTLKKSKLKLNDIDHFIFHQANLNLINYLIEKLNISKNKVHNTITKYGNTADASLAITLADAVERKKIKKGDYILISGVGAGFVFGCTILKWF